MTENSKVMFERAKQVIPGGVNSPVRAFKSVGGNPLFIEKADGSKIYDIDGNSYIDYVCSWGPMILGHNKKEIREAVISAASNGLSFGAPTELEVVLAEKMMEYVPNLELVRMVNSGTEAVMSALRLARGFTGKNKIIKFEGCYHGHTDSMLVRAGSGILTMGESDSSGVTDTVANDTLVAVYNDLDSVSQLLDKYEVAAIIVEPVAANMGVVVPADGFLKGLRDLCDKHNALLIFDEVITGFRLLRGGAQAFYNVRADLVTFGKIIGGGMPVGAYGGRREIMACIAPLGSVYQAGTLSGNPIAMTAGITQLNLLVDDGVYQHINHLAMCLEKGLNDIIKRNQIDAITTRVGSLLCMFFGISSANNYREVKAADTERYGKYFRGMLECGIYLAPSQFEAMFVSYSHTENDIAKTLECAEKVLIEMRKEG